MKQLWQGYAVPVLKRSTVKKICLSSIAATLALSMNAYSHDNNHNQNPTTQKADLIFETGPVSTVDAQHSVARAVVVND